MEKFIDLIYVKNLCINDGITYYTTDEWSKQYRCENAMWLLSVLECTYMLIMARLNNTPGHEKSKIYDINRSDKTNFYKLRMIGTKESNNEIRIVVAASLVCEKNKEG